MADFVAEPPTGGKVSARRSSHRGLANRSHAGSHPHELRLDRYRALDEGDPSGLPKLCPTGARGSEWRCVSRLCSDAHAFSQYFDKTVFHRVIRNFILQGGDPTGTGKGGESIYGRPFKDEFHHRLRFSHRGIVACANENAPNTNGSQFFITLTEAKHLNDKHTIFGKVVGDSYFVAQRIGELDTDGEDRPSEPVTIEAVTVLDHPFDDIAPRVLPQRASRVEPGATSRPTRRPGVLQFGRIQKRSREGGESRVPSLATGAKISLDYADDEEDEVAAVPKTRAATKPVATGKEERVVDEKRQAVPTTVPPTARPPADLAASSRPAKRTHPSAAPEPKRAKLGEGSASGILAAYGADKLSMSKREKQSDTLKRLADFTSSLRQGGDRVEWAQGTLKFRKHMDDAFRAAAAEDASMLVTIDERENNHT
jgi:cyclophilin family peptidyl-prolyl cis-trans isomerase